MKLVTCQYCQWSTSTKKCFRIQDHHWFQKLSALPILPDKQRSRPWRTSRYQPAKSDMGTDLLAPAGPELQSPDHKGHIQSANWHVSTNEVEFGHLTPRHQMFRGGGVLREGAGPSVTRWSWWTCNTTLCLKWWLLLEVHLASQWRSHWRPRFNPVHRCRLCEVCTFSLWPHGFSPTFQIPGYLCYSTTKLPLVSV